VSDLSQRRVLAKVRRRRLCRLVPVRGDRHAQFSLGLLAIAGILTAGDSLVLLVGDGADRGGPAVRPAKAAVRRKGSTGLRLRDKMRYHGSPERLALR
jgi:hypothetical protein